MEHLAHDTNSIKATLDFMAKYIRNKSVNDIQANNITEFEGMGDAIWNFISLVYKAKWDSLHTDRSTNMLRSKISLKFTPRTPPAKGNSNKEISKSTPVTVLQQNHIFDNITLALKPRVIKVSPKSDMAIVWINIWDVQSGQKAKMLINRCFNVSNYIATIRGANMNPGVP